MRISLLKYFILSWAVTLIACSGSKKKAKLDVPTNMPEICHGVDFNLDVEMRDVCGVKARSYRSYKNIPQYRILLRPKNAKVVKKGKKIELRVPKMIPISLPEYYWDKIEFNEQARQKFLKNTWDYHEIYNKQLKRKIKMMKMSLPIGKEEKGPPICYKIQPQPETKAKIKRGYAKQLEEMDCEVFDKLKGSS